MRSLVQMHGGSVQAFSGGVGAGSEFVVRLPALVGTAEGSLCLNRNALAALPTLR